MRQWVIGMALAIQFFSSIPVNRQLPMDRKSITGMYAALPVLGAGMGGTLVLAVFLFTETMQFSGLFVAFLLVLLSAVLTGGLHLDGLADTGDAFFSYQEQEKRLAILEDPRIGAFGTLTLIFALLGKLVIIAEIIPDVPLLAVAAVPVLSRIGLLLLFSGTASTKNTGLAAFFMQHANRRLLQFLATLYLLIVIAAGALLNYALPLLILSSILLVSLLWYRRWCSRHFGGVTGDLFGAYIEGTELLLWTVLLFLN
ncbi:adenosylcobinamide-GDP ribazoletransferase [Planococcus lenghuensis]|uniref:Adenosylcobinamide-GDP ribazoletransferase n=1 Tax=Planococcus lenghuensis TaxID=2213202 RepID=A0A1Q2L354_9BACL|nr:adenosylcobinamide-GDP ribazoletransferase [Planococcus lenghuensis]AQQ54312.1 adenosylcobinamide-GDP ribazoletransferase [Planococcus lenghuensis]